MQTRIAPRAVAAPSERAELPVPPGPRRRARPADPDSLGRLSMTIKAAIAVTGFSRDAIYNLINDGSVRSFLMGNRRYIDAATTIAQVNGQPYSNHDWHWRLLVAHQFGHAAAAPAVHGTLRLLDEMGIRGELKLRDYRTGRVETTQMWGRPESVRQEFRRLRQQ